MTNDAPATNGNHVVLRGVTKRYGSRTVLDEISMTIGSGQTAALIGPSGGGKSTILRCINGLNSFEAGQITVGPHVLEPSSPVPSAPSAHRTSR